MKVYCELHCLRRVVISPNLLLLCIYTLELITIRFHFCLRAFKYREDAGVFCSLYAEFDIWAEVILEWARAVAVAILFVAPAVLFNQQLSVLLTLRDRSVWVEVCEGSRHEEFIIIWCEALCLWECEFLNRCDDIDIFTLQQRLDLRVQVAEQT